jgi:hypothetical protein
MYKVFNKVTGLNIMSPLSCGEHRVFSPIRKGYSHIVTKYLTTNYTTDSTMSKDDKDPLIKPAVGRKLPNEAVTSEKLTKDLYNFRYDLISGDWFEYKEEYGRWSRLSTYEIDQKIFLLLKSTKEVQGLLTSDYKNRVKLALEIMIGVNFESMRFKNKELKLVPFLSGILDQKNNKILNHNKDYNLWFNINYEPDAHLTREIKELIISVKSTSNLSGATANNSASTSKAANNVASTSKAVTDNESIDLVNVESSIKGFDLFSLIEDLLENLESLDFNQHAGVTVLLSTLLLIICVSIFIFNNFIVNKIDNINLKNTKWYFNLLKSVINYYKLYLDIENYSLFLGIFVATFFLFLTGILLLII